MEAVPFVAGRGTGVGQPGTSLVRRHALSVARASASCQRWMSAETTTQETEDEYHSIIKDTERGKGMSLSYIFYYHYYCHYPILNS